MVREIKPLKKYDLESLFSQFLEEKYGFSSAVLEEPHIPSCIFSAQNGTLESVVKYLRENLSLTPQEIGQRLKRTASTITVTYHKVKKKNSTPFKITRCQFIPLSAFCIKDFSILESVVFYLKEKKQMSFHAIAELLKRDDRTIWTIYQRVTKKNDQ